MDEAFGIISKALNAQHRKNPKNKGTIRVKSLPELYDCLTEHRELNPIFIIDQISSIQKLLFFKKDIFKFISLTNSFDNVKFILISNFDITKSEAFHYFDFSNFITLSFPPKNKDVLKEIIKSKVDSPNNKNGIDDLINNCVTQFEYPFANMNEIINCTKENINKIFPIDINISDSGAPSSNTMKISDRKALTENIALQIQFSPIHVEKAEKNEFSKNNIIDDQKGKDIKSSQIIKNNPFLEEEKNLTEGLSICQKILLLSSFCANLTSESNDPYVFLNNKKVKRLKGVKSKSKRKAPTLTEKVKNPFNVQRLEAIFYSFVSVIYQNKEKDSIPSDNMNLACDVNIFINF